jgi:hypothetical protein
VSPYLAYRAAVGEARLAESDHVPWGLIADHIEVVLQGSVSSALEVHQLRGLIHPDLERITDDIYIDGRTCIINLQ